MSKIPVRILGTGSYLPARRLSSCALEQELGYAPGTIERASGVKTRYYAAGETTTDMGAKAAEIALERAGLHREEVDAIISVSGVPQQAIPTNAAHMHKKLGLLPRAVAFDINSTCLSFLTGLVQMGSVIASGLYKNVLLISADMGSAALDPKDPKTASLFGDGAAACVLGKSSQSGILRSHFETYSDYTDTCRCEAGGTLFGLKQDIDRERYYFRMNGPQLFKATVPRVMAMIEKMQEHMSDKIDLYIPHQASPLALDLFQKKLGVKEEHFVHIVRDYGNMIATSLPFALNKAIEDNQLKRGDRALLLGSGAGLTIGGVLIEY